MLIGILIPIEISGTTRQLNHKENEIHEAFFPLADRIPKINASAWVLQIDGLIQRPLNLTYDELRTLPVVSILAEYICVDGRFMMSGNWTGVQLSYFLTLVEVLPGAKEMIFHAADEYYQSFPLSEIKALPDLLLAYEKDGATLTINEGFPALVVAPGRPGLLWVKYVIRIEISGETLRGDDK